MSEGELRDRYIANLRAERDRLVAGCRATADWLEGVQADYRVDLLGSIFREFESHVAALRRLFLPPERYSDVDTVAVRTYGEEGGIDSP